MQWSLKIQQQSALLCFKDIVNAFGSVDKQLQIAVNAEVVQEEFANLSLQCKEVFSKLMILGLTTTFTLYIFINLGMVMGLAPVVGVPLPLISYGGTVILAVMGGFGLILSAHLHRGVELPRNG